MMILVDKRHRRISADRHASQTGASASTTLATDPARPATRRPDAGCERAACGPRSARVVRCASPHGGAGATQGRHAGITWASRARHKANTRPSPGVLMTRHASDPRPDPGNEPATNGETGPAGLAGADMDMEPSGLPAIEHAVLARWAARAVPGRSLARTAGGPAWTCWTEPQTAAGLPGLHDVPDLAVRDAYQRLSLMRGRDVRGDTGIDCHAPAVEVGVERELGLSGLADIEAYGVERFNARCRESAARHAAADHGSGLCRIRLVVAASGLRRRPARAQLPGHSVLPALPDPAVRARPQPPRGRVVVRWHRADRPIHARDAA